MTDDAEARVREALADWLRRDDQRVYGYPAYGGSPREAFNARAAERIAPAILRAIRAAAVSSGSFIAWDEFDSEGKEAILHSALRALTSEEGR